MALDLSLIRKMQAGAPRDVWPEMVAFAWQTCSASLPTPASAEVTRRDREVAQLDLFLTTAAWELWSSFDQAIEPTADALATWWQARPNGKAVLLLDALSLREVPWILAGAAARGYQINARVTGSELPADTTSFAKALGFAQRSALENDGAGGAHRLPGAKTESVGLPWADCARLIGAEPNWFFWHHWPDERLHDCAVPGKGLNTLTAETTAMLTNDDFWYFVERLTTGRSLVITSDHGYAASGLFPDTSDEQQAKYLKETFKSGRSCREGVPSGGWLPPVELRLTTRSGTNHFVLGRRKWKSQGGYPTLAHGGLSLLETLVPFVELTR